MILPEKHIKVSESLFALGGYVLKQLERPKTVDAIWLEYAKINDTVLFPAYHSFDNLVLAIDFLFAIGAVNITKTGEIYNASLETIGQ